MSNPKYLIIVTLIEGQNFTVPDGSPDRVEATVFAEARFGNESKLRSDPIKLTNSNPEFVTELAWQLDKKSLHQLRVERKAIKLQIFMQTRSKKKLNQHQFNDTHGKDGATTDQSSSSNKIELVGYTVIDIRSAQDREQPKFKWLPLLNPKFRKSSYNRPEVQLALTLNKIEDTIKNIPSTSDHPHNSVASGVQPFLNQSEAQESDVESFADSNLYRTCLEINSNSDDAEKEQILENDIIIRVKDRIIYVYDTHDSTKSSMDDCDERFRITITIPFNSDLHSLVIKPSDKYYFSVVLFGTSYKTIYFEELTSVETKKIEYNICTTHSRILAKYFELNPSLEIFLHDSSDQQLGLATIQLDQLCNLDTKCRSIEGIFAMQPINGFTDSASVHPTIGVSVILKRLESHDLSYPEEHLSMEKEHFEGDYDDYLFKTSNGHDGLTQEDNDLVNVIDQIDGTCNSPLTNEMDLDDHHFCFTIDLKNFSYTPDQRLIPTLRELVVRYAYPFFGYKDTITTDTSIPISRSNSIIVSGFCEFNFATSSSSLLTALQEVPLNLDILTSGQTKRVEIDSDHFEQLVATCSINIAEVLNLTYENLKLLRDQPISKTILAPIYELNRQEIGHLSIYLHLVDLGPPAFKSKVSTGDSRILSKNGIEDDLSAMITQDSKKIDSFIAQAKVDLDTWKSECCLKISEESRKRENERFKRLYQRFEARDTRREQEFRKKMDELSSLELKLKNSLSYLDSFEQKLTKNLEDQRMRDSSFITQLDSLDSRISKAIEGIRLEYQKKINLAPAGRSPGDENSCSTHHGVRLSSKPLDVRRSSLRSSNISPGIPLPVRSSSLVRGPSEGTSTRFLKRPVGLHETITRQRSNSSRITLTKEAQEKLASLRREKAELLKRGCRPNDEMIQEINSLIEKLVC